MSTSDDFFWSILSRFHKRQCVSRTEGSSSVYSFASGVPVSVDLTVEGVGRKVDLEKKVDLTIFVNWQSVSSQVTN